MLSISVILKRKLSLAILLICFFNDFSQNKPNILWLVCEDQSLFFSAYGDSSAQTPNINELALRGTVYDNFYAVSPVCSPSRSSIITGMYPTTIGTQNMRAYKKNKGLINSKTNLPIYSAVPKRKVQFFTEILRANGYYCSNNSKEDYNMEMSPLAWDESNKNAHWRNRAKNQPFFSVFNFNITHESRIWERSNKPLTVNPQDVEIPSYFPDIPEVRNDIARKYSNIEAMDEKVGEIISQLEEDGLLENTIIMFWSDHGGNLLRQKRAVGNSGLNVPLIIRYPNKIDAGKVDDRIVSLMDLGPTVLSLLNIEPPKHYDGKAIAGQYEESPRKYAFGTADRFDESTDMQRSVLDGRYVYIKNFMPELPLIYRNKYRERITMNYKLIQLDSLDMLEGDAKYIFMKTKPIEEFYDLETDPYEVDNIIDDPKYADRINNFRDALQNWQNEINDQGFIPENKIVESFWPNLIQPKTENVEFKMRDDGLYELISITNGASIGYQIEDQIGTNSWNLYFKPILLGDKQKIVARAIRLGYKASEITSN